MRGRDKFVHCTLTSRGLSSFGMGVLKRIKMISLVRLFILLIFDQLTLTYVRCTYWIIGRRGAAQIGTALFKKCVSIVNAFIY